MIRLFLIIILTSSVNLCFGQKLVDSRKLRNKINWYRVMHLRPPMIYRKSQQAHLDSLAIGLTISYKHTMSKTILNEVIARKFSPNELMWDTSKKHKKALLRYKALYFCVATVEHNGEYFSIARTYSR